jgi:hypothetical protein
VQTLYYRAFLIRLHAHIQRAGGRINDRSGCNPDLGFEGITETVFSRDRSDPLGGIDEADLPKGLRRFSITIEGVQLVMLSGDVDYIVSPLTGDADIGYIQRLSISLALERVRENLAKTLRVYERGSESCLLQVLSGSSVIVVPGENSGKALAGCREGTT